MFFDTFRPQLSQIYRALDEMEKDNQVEYIKVQERRKPIRKIFRITEQGLSELNSWTKDTHTGILSKEPYILRLWFGGLISYEDQIAGLQAYVDEVRSELEYYNVKGQSVINSLKKKSGLVDRFYFELTLDYLRDRANNELKRAELALKKIYQFKSNNIKPAGTKTEKQASRKK